MKKGEQRCTYQKVRASFLIIIMMNDEPQRMKAIVKKIFREIIKKQKSRIMKYLKINWSKNICITILKAKNYKYQAESRYNATTQAYLANR